MVYRNFHLVHDTKTQGTLPCADTVPILPGVLQLRDLKEWDSGWQIDVLPDNWFTIIS